MTYFPDGSPYAYGGHLDPTLVCAGWLGARHPFRIAEAPEGFLDRLAWRCINQLDRSYLGIHICELCPAHTFLRVSEKYAIAVDYVSVVHNSKKYLLGSAEITVHATARTYAAPNLVLHYVAAHGYLPPDDLVEAVMRGGHAETLTGWSLFCGPYWD